MDDSFLDDRAKRILAVARDWWRRWCAGDPTTESEVFALYPDLMPELAGRLQLLRRIRRELPTDTARLSDSELEVGPGLDLDSPILVPNSRLVDSPGSRSISFTPGTEIADRFTISCRLGEGGLGIVFLAHDKVLNKPVALKFFRDTLITSDRHRIEAEVALSQRLSHVNVCRVHDLNVSHRPMFLFMEYIDGEDLERTLLRVGRIMPHRALHLAMDICAGLAAAHDSGVVHRDLKPQNVMIDSSGVARITDFGLGCLTIRSDATIQIVGTQAYMAPEQAAGGEATERSDLFSLGIVLYELFTGEYPIDLDAEWDTLPWHTSRIMPPSDIVPQIDPHVERTILQCLELAPEDRPSSAKEVLRALSGDRAERTLTPRVTPFGRSTRRRSIRWLTIVTLLGLIAGWLVSPRFRMIEALHFEKRSFDDYRDSATSLFREAGYTIERAPGKTESGFQYDAPFVNDATGINQSLSYWHRQSPWHMVPHNYTISREQSCVRVSFDDPPWVAAGMVGARFAVDGTLMEFRAIPRKRDASATDLAGETRLDRLFDTAGLDLTQYEQLYHRDPIEYGLGLPFSSFGEPRHYRAKNAGLKDPLPDVVVNFVGEEIVWFRVSPEANLKPHDKPRGKKINEGMYVCFMACGIAGCVLARRNTFNSRADRRGARRSSVAIFFAIAFSWCLTAHHVPVFEGEVQLAQFGFANALFWAGTQWLLYMSVEPFLRWELPVSMTSWSRVINGNWRDELVARDILVGCMFGATVTPILGTSHHLLRTWLGMTNRYDIPPVDLNALGQPSYMLAIAANALINAIYSGFVLLLLPLIMTKLFGNRRLGVFGGWLILTWFLGSYYDAGIQPWSDRLLWFAYMSVWAAVFLFVVHRFGLLSTMSMVWTFQMVVFTPSTLAWDRWYAATAAVTGVCMAVAFIGYAVYVLSGRKSAYM